MYVELAFSMAINVNIKLKPKIQLLKTFAVKLETFGLAVVVLIFFFFWASWRLASAWHSRRRTSCVRVTLLKYSKALSQEKSISKIIIGKRTFHDLLFSLTSCRSAPTSDIYIYIYNILAIIIRGWLFYLIAFMRFLSFYHHQLGCP